MPLDRVVLWQQKRPNKKQLAHMIEDYIGEAGKVEWKTDRWYCTLHGKPSAMFRRILPLRQNFGHDERWFEIFIGEDGIDVLTRSADEFTNAVAKEFAERVARFWGARLERE